MPGKWWVDSSRHYNEVRLNSAIGYVAPADKLKGKDKQIFKDRDSKLESARQARKVRRAEANAREVLANTPPIQAATPPTSSLERPILEAAA